MSTFRKITLGSAVVVGTAACVLLVVTLIGQGLVRASLYAGVVAAVAGVVAAVAAVWAVAFAPSRALLPPGLEVPEWVVDRPAELAAVVEALVGRPSGMVGITTGLYGAGGFGKTTLAQMVCADRRVRRRFRGRVYLVTVGRDVRGAPAIAAKVNDVIKLIAGEDAAFTDPQLAGRRLGSLLDAGPRRLIVLDDVWDSEQLAPFAEGGRRCGRLVTTRVPGLLTGRAVAVPVDQMSEEQAHSLLTSGLPRLDALVIDKMLSATGRWPLLLRLVNKILADYARVAPDVSTKAVTLLDRLRFGGPTVVDDVLGETHRVLDVGEPRERALAVRATIEASTGLLEGQDAERFAELGVFAEGETIPFDLITRLWKITSGLDDLHAAQVCQRLSQLALVSEATGPSFGVVLHSVIRDFLRSELGKRLAMLNGMLLDGIAADLPNARPLAEGLPSPEVAWWQLEPGARYLWDHLIEHLLDARRDHEAEGIACDLRWAGARLQRFGAAAPFADLSLVETSRAHSLRDVLTRMVHLLAPTEPTEAVADILYSRIADEPEWGRQAVVLLKHHRPRLAACWPLPDLPDVALRRVLTSYTGRIKAVAVAPDGSWLASGSWDGVTIWDVTTGQIRTSLKSRKHAGVEAVAVAPGGSWVAAGCADGAVRIWDVATGQIQATLKSRRGRSDVIAVAPDGSWLAAGGWDGVVRIWHMATGQIRTLLKGHTDLLDAIAITSDGNWLASKDQGGLVRIWDLATGRIEATLEENRGVVAAPDGILLAMGSGGLRIWDMATRQVRAVSEDYHGRIDVAAPDGGWLACRDGNVVRILDVASGQVRTTLSGHTDAVSALAVAPDGSWIASGSNDATVRIWDTVLGSTQVSSDQRAGSFSAIAVASDDSWLSSADKYGNVQTWDSATGEVKAALFQHAKGVSAVALALDGSLLATGNRDGTAVIWFMGADSYRIAPQYRPRYRRYYWNISAVTVAPDGRWVASGSGGGTVLVFDMNSGKSRVTLYRHLRGVSALASAPDGRWIASGGRGRWVRLWDATTGRKIATLKGHTAWVNAIAIAPDGSWLASGSDDGTIRIWDMATRRARAILTADAKGASAVTSASDINEVSIADAYEGGKIGKLTMSLDRAVLTGNVRGISAVAISPNNTFVASATWGGTVQIWDAATGQAMAAMRVEGGIKACAFLGPDGLAVAGPAGLYRFDFVT